MGTTPAGHYFQTLLLPAVWLLDPMLLAPNSSASWCPFQGLVLAVIYLLCAFSTCVIDSVGLEKASKTTWSNHSCTTNITTNGITEPLRSEEDLQEHPVQTSPCHHHHHQQNH